MRYLGTIGLPFSPFTRRLTRRPRSSPGTGGPVDLAQAGLDVTALDELYFHDALAPSTQHTYASAQSRYINFCHLVLISPFPVTEPGLSHDPDANFQPNLQTQEGNRRRRALALRHLQQRASEGTSCHDYSKLRTPVGPW